MSANRIGSILVLNSAELVGIVTERDLLRLAHEQRDPTTCSLSEAMSSPVQTLPYYASISRVLYFMYAGGYRHLPITGPIKNQLSVVSVKDIVTYLNLRLANKIITASPDLEIDDDLIELFAEPISILHPHALKTLTVSASVGEGVHVMSMEGAGSVIVTREGGGLAGIFTERDLMTRVLATGRSISATDIESVMTPNPRTLCSTGSIALALSEFATSGFRHMPVVNPNEQLAGVLSVKDFTGAIVHEVLREIG
jgi:CBS domain-containing protein